MGNNCQVKSVTLSPNKTVPVQQDQTQGTADAMRNGNEEGLSIANGQSGSGQVVFVFQPAIKANSPSNSNMKQPGTCTSETSKSRMTTTLQQYRKEIGLKLQNEKRNQKLGISVSKPILEHTCIC